ncbi:multicopper oxidase family protein [Bradyrhizobium guangdongense]|uniref:multicopper oxidase family protein n=1 Tax=Bradyrhizobium guangdongense TaxID=1325090 RepID=UPI001FEEF416|nr:multicopper oxidase domain-containing protein [Bradyrhizobium guangdongense]
MTSDESRPNRRALLAGIAAAAIAPSLPARPVWASQIHLLVAGPSTLSLRPNGPATPVWSFAGPDLRLRRGQSQEISFENRLPFPAAITWRGLDAAAASEPLLGRRPVAAKAKENSTISVPHAGTLMVDLRLLEDGVRQPARPLPMIVQETEPVAVDRDERFLIEDWRVAPDGTAVMPGAAGGDIAPIYTVNGKVAPDFTLRVNERLRLRLINGCQRAVVAMKIEGVEVMVMALDGQPAEPFLARNGAVVLAPGGRADVFLDGTGAPGSAAPILLHDGKEAHPLARLVTSAESPLRSSRLQAPPPLPSNGLPVELGLKNALRFDVALGAPDSGWMRPQNFAASAAPIFRAKAGRTVVLALKNSGPIANVFHLHGHHFRLLDRLDDGWKPYWLDTLAVEPGQTQRIAFAATYPGRYLIQSFAADWAAPRLVRWYAVE